MKRYSIHQPSLSETAKLDKPMRPLNVLLVHQDRSFVTWFENEFARIFTLRVMSNPENALTHIKNGYRPHIIIGDVRYGKASGLEFFLQVKYLCTEGVRVIFSRSMTAQDMDALNDQTAIHRFIKLPRPGTDIHYQLRLLIEQFIPLQRSSTSLQALLFPNGAPKRVRRGSDFASIVNADATADGSATSEEEGNGPDGDAGRQATPRRRFMQHRPFITSAVESVRLGSVLLEADEPDTTVDASDDAAHPVRDHDLTTADEAPASMETTDVESANDDRTSGAVPDIRGIDTALSRSVSSLHGSAALGSLIRLLSGIPQEMHRYHVNNHAHGVADISVALATAMSLSPEEIDTIRIAALLHDCGKYGMEERILSLAPELLSESDRNRYASHTERGRALIAGIDGMELVSKIVAQHHERYDGSGFPEKLEGPQIILGAQIINIADEYHNRVYRLPNFTRMSSASRTRETTLSSVAIEYRQAQALAMITNQQQRFAPAVRAAFMDLAYAETCPLVRPGTVNAGDDPALVDELAKKYSAGTSSLP
ncbi:MAG: HD domain-containing phosphohydrolase [Candidatus Kapaibacterium sp.]